MTMLRAAVRLAVAALVLALPASAAARPGGGSSRLPTLDSHLQQVFADDAAGRSAQRSGNVNGVEVSGRERALVDVYVKGRVGAAAQALAAEGMKVLATSDKDPFRLVEGWLPVSALDDAAALDSTKGIVAAERPQLNAGTVQSEGDASHRGPQARAAGPNGAGVTVGVVSDSINQKGAGVAGSQASGNLPGTVTVFGEVPGGSDEGRAMGEIVYDTAPGMTNMLFDSGNLGGAAGKAAAINNLVANGADLITDDTFNLAEPFFQDGLVAQTTDAAVASGVPYLISAGNRRRQSYEGTFNSDGQAPPFHDFDAGGPVNNIQNLVNVANGDVILIELQWAEPFGSVATDMDTFLYNANNVGAGPLASATTNNTSATGTGQPRERLQWTNNTGGDVTVGVAVQRFNDPPGPDPFFKHIVHYPGGNGFDFLEFNTGHNAIDPDGSSAVNALTVAAVDFSDPGLNDPEGFSSRGPAFKLFDDAGNPLAQAETRQKPDIAAADKVNTTVPGFQPFFGTSAAAPSAAGIAALMMSANPGISAGQVNSILKDPTGAIDCTAAGNPDDDCGSGFVLADTAVSRALATRPAGGSGAPPFFVQFVQGVRRVAAIAGLKIARSISLRKLFRSGLLIELQVGANNTNLVADAILNTAGKSAAGAKRVRVGRVRKKNARAGRARLRLKIAKRYRRLLRRKRRTKLAIRVVGKGAGATTTLRRNVTVKR